MGSCAMKSMRSFRKALLVVAICGSLMFLLLFNYFLQENVHLTPRSVPSQNGSGFVHVHELRETDISHGSTSERPASAECCSYSNWDERENLIVETNPYYFVKKDIIGRLGNQMFQYASVYGIARLYNATLAIEPGSKLETTFINTKAHQLPTDGIAVHQRVYEQGASIFNRKVLNLRAVNTSFQGYLISYKYFHNYSSEIRRQFVFENNVYISVFKFLDNVMKKFKTPISRTCILAKIRCLVERRLSEIIPENATKGHPTPDGEPVTLIGIHVRRGDKLNKNEWGSTVPGPDYFQRAISYYNKRFRNIIFVVCSEDKEWVTNYILNDTSISITLSYLKTPEEDMSLLTLCDHVILSDGSTFGFWSAYLGGGHVVYWRGWPRPKSDLAKEINLSDRWLPHWVAL